MTDTNTTISMLIDGEDAVASNGRSFERCDPVTGNVTTRAPAASLDDADRAVAAAQRAFPEWSRTTPNARRAMLLKAADALESRLPDFVAILPAETGGTRGWAGFNIHLAASMLREAASLTTQITGETIPSDRPGCMAISVRQPAGVCLGIAPWNAPVILGVRAIATPLACGNTVVLKASEMCPAVHLLIGQAFRDAGFSPGVVNVVTNAPEDAPAFVERLIRNKAVKRVNFTGSTKVGRVIARLCGEELKPALLELGGKAPLVVLDDADLDEAVAAAAFGAFMNSGQICMSTERLVVVDAIADRFVEAFATKARTLVAASPADGDAPLGAVVSPQSAAHVAALVEDAVAKGATAHRSGEGDGTVIPAIVLDKVTPAMRIYGEESFGPVTCVVRVRDEDEAIAVANDTEYGLTSAVFTGDAARGLRVAERIEAGMCHINGPTVHDEAQMPFGGVKASGYGRFGGRAGIAEFTDLRWITVDTQPGHYPI